MYLGGGLNYYFNFVNNDQKLSYNSTSGADKTEAGDGENSYSFGLNVLIGVEWFVRSNIGIIAEYGSEYRYSKITYDSNLIDSYGKRTISSDNYNEYSFSPSYVKFGISIYF